MTGKVVRGRSFASWFTIAVAAFIIVCLANIGPRRGDRTGDLEPVLLIASSHAPSPIDHSATR